MTTKTSGKKIMLTRENIIKFVKKHYWLALFAVVFIGVVIMNAIPDVYATESMSQAEVKEKYEAFLLGYKETTFHYMKEALGTFSELSKQLTNTALGSAISDFILGFGQAMVVLCSVLGIIQEAHKTNGDVGEDYWLKVILYTATACIVILSIGEIMDKLFDLGVYVADSVSKKITVEYTINTDSLLGLIDGGDVNSSLPGAQHVAEIVQATSTNPTWYQMQGAGSFVSLLMIVAWAPMIVCCFLIFSALFEVSIRRLFAPIAVATIATEGGRSAGVKYLKKYVACFIKMAIYFAIAAMGAYVTWYFLKDAAAGSIQLILGLGANVLAALAMLQTGGIADEIVGA